MLKQCVDEYLISRCFSPFSRSGPRLSSRARTCRSRGSAGTRSGVWCCVCDGVSSPPDASRENLPEPVHTRRRPYHTRYPEPRHTRCCERVREWRARWSYTGSWEARVGVAPLDGRSSDGKDRPRPKRIVCFKNKWFIEQRSQKSSQFHRH